MDVLRNNIAFLFLSVCHTSRLQAARCGREYSAFLVFQHMLSASCMWQKVMIFEKILFSLFFNRERKSFLPLHWYGGATLAIQKNSPLVCTSLSLWRVRCRGLRYWDVQIVQFCKNSVHSRIFLTFAFSYLSSTVSAFCISW